MCVFECVCVYVSAVAIQTIGTISMKFGAIEDCDQRMALCMLDWSPEARKPLLAQPSTVQKIS